MKNLLVQKLIYKKKELKKKLKRKKNMRPFKTFELSTMKKPFFFYSTLNQWLFPPSFDLQNLAKISPKCFLIKFTLEKKNCNEIPNFLF